MPSAHFFTDDLEFDFVIVGAGAAGCVLANRLSENPENSVLLIEAGGSDRHPLIRIPAGFFYLLTHPKLSWGFKTEPEEGTYNRAINYPRGKVLGGSSSINGMWQSWGLPRDYDSWAKAGCDGWSFDDIAQYMMKSETYEAGSEGRGKTGPLIISDFVKHHPLTEDFIRAGRELQLPVLKDYNRDTREGVGLVQQTRTGRFRVSTATAYLRPAMSRRNLTVVCHAHACQITVRNQVATGVTYRRHGETKTARARHEVILSAGAIGSPHLLQLSGIGKSGDLQALGIPVILDLPGVGYNLQDHYLARVVYEVSGQLTLNELSRGWRLWREIARYIFKGEGILTYSAGNGTGFFRSHPALPQPDLQFNFTPASYSSARIGKLETVPAVSCSVWQMRPESRGRISAKSTDPFAAPDISPAYLTAEIDRKAIVEGLRMCRRVMNSSAFAANRKAERLPGAAVECYDDWLDFARRTGSTVYHPVGTCRMGAGEDAVVAPDLKVRNIERLRVIDASIMPSITSSNTHAPTVMIAEKGAAMVLADLRRKRTP